jgi:hypothetical protein
MEKINDSDVDLESEELGLDAKLGFDAHLLVLLFVFPSLRFVARPVPFSASTCLLAASIYPSLW